MRNESRRPFVPPGRKQKLRSAPNLRGTGMFDGIRDAARGVVAGRVGHGLPVDYTDDWDRGPWLLLTNGVLSAERQEVIDFSITNRARRFYRTVVQPCQPAFAYGVNVPRSAA